METYTNNDVETKHNLSPIIGSKLTQLFSIDSTHTLRLSNKMQSGLEGNTLQVTERSVFKFVSDKQMFESVCFFKSDLSTTVDLLFTIVFSLTGKYTYVAGSCIEEMLGWKGDYVKLERGHSYIQW